MEIFYSTQSQRGSGIQLACPAKAEVDPAGTDPCVKNYKGAIRELDESVGDLVDGLKQRGKYKNTLFLFTSDNGQEFPGRSPGLSTPYRGCKNYLYEGGHHVPGILSWPDYLNVNDVLVNNKKRKRGRYEGQCSQHPRWTFSPQFTS